MIGTGTAAPPFSLPNQAGETVTLESLRGRTVVLYFYPRADTPGCTTQACSIRDRRAEYDAAGATVIGVSPDTPAAVARFHGKFGLSFDLLADEDHAVAEAFGVWVEKQNYGKTSWGVQRATFVIDPEGVVAHVLPKASPKTHDDVILGALADLAAA